MSEQQQVPPLYEEETETEEQKEKKQRLKTLFADLESKQPDVLDEAGKSMIERIATFLAILFAVTALGSSFPPKYLVGNPRDKYLVIAILICYLLAMCMAMWAIHPRNYGLYLYNVTRQEKGLCCKNEDDLVSSASMREQQRSFLHEEPESIQMASFRV